MLKLLGCVILFLLPLGASAQSDVFGAGATFPSEVYQAWAVKYEKLYGKKVVYNPTGSGDGVKKIIARAVAFGGTDSAMSEADLAKNHLVQLPTLVGGIVPVVNIRGLGANDLRLTGDVLADIFRGQISAWNDKRIQAINPGLALPAQAIVLVVRSDKSGSTEGFTKYLALVSPGFKKEIGVSSLPKWPGTSGAVMAAEGNDGVAKTIREVPGAISYLSYDRVIKYGLASARLRGGDGTTFVAANEDSFRAAVKASDMVHSGDEMTSLLNMPAAAAWPITLTTFVLMDAQPKTASSVSTAMHFLYWTQLSGCSLLRNTGFAPLPIAIQAKFSARFARIRPQDGLMIKLM